MAHIPQRRFAAQLTALEARIIQATRAGHDVQVYHHDLNTVGRRLFAVVFKDGRGTIYSPRADGTLYSRPASVFLTEEKLCARFDEMDVALRDGA